MRLREAFNLLNIMHDYPTQNAMAKWNTVTILARHFDYIMDTRALLRLMPNGDMELVCDILCRPDFRTHIGEYRLPHEEQFIDDTNWGMSHPDNLAHVVSIMYIEYLRGSIDL